MSANPSSSQRPESAPLRHLARASRDLGAEPEPARAVGKLLRTLCHDLQVDRAGVFAFDRRANTLQFLGGVDPSRHHTVSNVCIPLDEEPAPVKRVARRELSHYYSPAADRGVPSDPWAPGLPAQAVVPVVCGGQVLGLLCADNLVTGTPMPEWVLDPLFLYAGLAVTPLFSHFQRRDRDRLDGMRRRICREVLFSVTSGKIQLCDERELEEEWPSPARALPIRQPEDIRVVREAVRDLGRDAGMANGRIEEFGLCACEAATNALVHGSGGEASLGCREGRLRIRVADGGRGIPPEDLPRATLMKGWSTRSSMGLGFTIIKESADRVLIATSPTGTTVIIDMAVEPPAVPLEQFHARLWSEPAPL